MTIAGYAINDARLAHWNGLLAQWMTNFERSCVMTATTPGWNAPEDSNRSAFEGAIWQTGWITMNETTIRRVPKQTSGQADCYLDASPVGPPRMSSTKGRRLSTVAQAAPFAEANAASSLPRTPPRSVIRTYPGALEWHFVTSSFPRRPSKPSLQAWPTSWPPSGQRCLPRRSPGVSPHRCWSAKTVPRL